MAKQAQQVAQQQYATASLLAIELFRSTLFYNDGHTSGKASLGVIEGIDDRIKLLCRFLTVKSRFSDVSPPLSVDQDWHTVLLCTAKYAKICEVAFGRMIHHSLDDAFQLTEAQKQERRQALLVRHSELFGDDKLHKKLNTATVPSKSLESSALCNDEPLPQASPDAAQAEGTSVIERLFKTAKRPPSEKAAPKKRVKADQESKRAKDSIIAIKLVYRGSDAVNFRCPAIKPFFSVARAYAAKKGFNLADLKFLLDARHLAIELSLAELGIEDGSVIDVYRQIIGC
eukprot:TRINITY_DN9030_c0_g1_i4.p2 TRINITY_DN9030_c0_g1~~TRINITY_DN9030_c0_g1_i4.p2  ORF type:complete len:286 (+),score=48.41 TRINITY_DN9030_c0_g1_i4:1659-2516(+)